MPVAGSRTWICVIAAPASAAPRQASAICSGVIGRCGVMLGSVWLPVTAQVMMTLSRGFCMELLLWWGDQIQLLAGCQKTPSPCKRCQASSLKFRDELIRLIIRTATALRQQRGVQEF